MKNLIKKMSLLIMALFFVIVVQSVKFNSSEDFTSNTDLSNLSLTTFLPTAAAEEWTVYYYVCGEILCDGAEDTYCAISDYTGYVYPCIF